MRLAESERSFQDHLARLIKAREGLEEQLKRVARGEDIDANDDELDGETETEQVCLELKFFWISS